MKTIAFATPLAALTAPALAQPQAADHAAHQRAAEASAADKIRFAVRKSEAGCMVTELQVAK